MTNEEKAKKLYEKLKSERKLYVEKHTKVKGYHSSRIWHRILLPLLKLLRVIEKQHITIIADEHTETTSSVIYACTHIGFYDPMIFVEVIKKPCWIFFWEPCVKKSWQKIRFLINMKSLRNFLEQVLEK